jgi:Recombination endonuclease VII
MDAKTMKNCGSCKELKENSEYVSVSKRGTVRICKNCSTCRQRFKNVYEANKDYYKKAAKKWVDNNRELVRAKERAWAKANPDIIRDKMLRIHYGMTLVQWNAVFENQGKVCALCGVSESGKRQWSTDHDHETAAVRGILCHSCNFILGRLGDSSDKIKINVERIFLYLSKSPVHPGRKKSW